MRMLSLLCVLVAVSGCPTPSTIDGGTGGGTGGGSNLGGGGGTLAPISIDDYCARVEPALCARAVRCGLVETQQGCEGLLSRNTGTLCDQVRPGVRDGRIAFDGALAAQCFQETTVSCTSLPACNGIFTGKVPVDGGCYGSTDCAPGAWCHDSLVCPGECLPRVGVGAVVRESQECLENLTAHLGVLDGGAFGYTCRARVALGQPCSSYGDCVDGLVCNSGSGSCETPRGPSVACAGPDGGNLPYSICSDGLSCQRDVNGRLSCLPPAALGERCGDCRLDLRCVASDAGSTCAGPGRVGEACARDTECELGLFCKPASGPLGAGFCAAPGGLGATCSGADSACTAGLRCAQVPPTDGGFFPDRKCVVSDGGTSFNTCTDPTP
jgi:hypothetical protein